MNYTLGYLKDGAAVILFSTSILVICSNKNIQHLKPVILSGLTFGLLLDTLFTVRPNLHNMDVKKFINP
jgi:hypothetical protein